MEILEKTQSWKEEEFDVVLQFMRTILLRRKVSSRVLSGSTCLQFADGASLIYTTPSIPSQLQTLVHSSLGIHSLLKRQPLKPNVIDRDKVAVPPNWDSWGKIRVLREGFNVEAVSEGWSIDLESKFPPPGRGVTDENGTADGGEYDADGYEIQPGSAVTMFEESIRNPSHDALQMTGRNTHSTELEVETQDTQDFLESQVTKLEAYKQKIEEESKEHDDNRPKKPLKGLDDDGRQNVSDHIGPVQFNVGGIQVDADDMVKRLQVRAITLILPTQLMLINHFRTVKHTDPRLSQRVQSRRRPRNPRSSTRTICKISLPT